MRPGVTHGTPHGTFRTVDVPHYGREADLYHGEVRKVTFAVGQSAFDADGAGDPEYWVLPLANFLSECSTPALRCSLREEFTPRSFKELLGHSTIAITLDTYSHVLPGMGDAAAGAMDEALG